jgi:hypothetical protein
MPSIPFVGFCCPNPIHDSDQINPKRFFQFNSVSAEKDFGFSDE